MDKLEKLVSDLEDLRTKDERLQEVIDNLKDLNSEIDLNSISKKKVKGGYLLFLRILNYCTKYSVE